MPNPVILITGATGHIGNVLARKLCQQGQRVRALILPGEDTRPLAGLPLEQVEGDVLNPVSLGSVFSGVDKVFHLAGLISILPGKMPAVFQVNVEGTRNILQAAITAGVRRLIYTSSIHALARLPHGQVVDERTPFDPDNPYGSYDRSKALATLEVQQAARCGQLDAVITCPTGVIGPFDFRGSMMGAYIRQAIERRPMPFIHGAYDFVDVRDVADGLLAADEKGQPGDVFILSGQKVSIPTLLDAVKKATGHGFARFRIPLFLANFAARFTPLYYRISHTIPSFTPYSIEVLQSNCDISHAKASQTLGYQPRPLAETLLDIAAWYLEQNTGLATSHIAL
jgi:dihydroflavonol-4-reductase